MTFRACMLLGVLLVSSCAKTVTTTKVPVAKNDWLTTLATEKIGEGSSIETNLTQSFALCSKNITNPSNNVPVLNFVIVRMSDHKVVEQGAVTMGEVKWKTDYQVEVSHTEGQVELERSANSTTRTIDLTKYLDVIGR